ncbi:NADP-dependent oxidoreductase [Rhodococcus sp. SORGH_AS_0301]|uniref:MDR family NADP-dependent oxidoreductase n=1 Tax=Rhodococcus sp. SORGH_AS_0301 TaxID=3041780 RepID=UPI00278279D8|nr:NADP-dependent oxidoreductase [Rhodococcus sp. SORGH_AS_0301]MDQ1181690.1 NADPH-dependent curcumin reductase CurA [Rhodococcus sp. SORGH_AS_0301]
MTGVISTRHVVLRSWPNGALTSGDLEVVEAPVPELRSGDVLVRNTWLSIDPSIRIRLSRQTPGGYLPPFAPGQALEGLALGVVERSESSAFAVGDIVTHTLGFREHALISADTATIGGYGSPTVVRPGGLPEQWFLGPLGSSGLTAYAGMIGILDVGPADTVWVSSAAGAVGGLAAGLAVARGATVIGSAGSAAKVAHLRASGLADAFDHHESLPAAVAAAAPDGIDAYFDCVGGDHLTAAIDALRPNGRIAMCGQMSQYDAADAPSLPGNLFQFVSKNLSMRGYRAGSFLHLEADMRAEITSLIDAGRLGYDEWVFDGLDSAPAALVSMLAGENIGKTLVRLG